MKKALLKSREKIPRPKPLAAVTEAGCVRTHNLFPCPNLRKLPILALKVSGLNQKSVCEGTTAEIGARAGAIVPTSGNC